MDGDRATVGGHRLPASAVSKPLVMARASHVPRSAGAAQGMVILIASLLPVMGIVLISPIAPLITATFRSSPGGEYLAAATLTAPALAIAICSPFMGALIDRLHSRLVLLVALVAYGVIGILPLWLNDLTLLFVARLALGVAESAILTTAFTLLAGYFEGSDRIRWLAYKTAAAGLGATGLYMLGGALGEISWRAPFAAYAVSLPIAIIAAAVIFEPSREGRLAPTGRNGGTTTTGTLSTVLILCGLTVMGAIFFYIVPIQLSVLLASVGVRSTAEASILIAIAGAGYPIGAMLYRFLNRAPSSMLMAVSGTVATLGLLLASTAQTLPLIVAGAFMHQLGSGGFVPIIQIALMGILPPDRRGVGGGGWVTAFFSGQFMCPLIVTLATRATGSVGNGFFVLSILLFGFTLLAVFMIRSLDGSAHPTRLRRLRA